MLDGDGEGMTLDLMILILESCIRLINGNSHHGIDNDEVKYSPEAAIIFKLSSAHGRGEDCMLLSESEDVMAKEGFMARLVTEKDDDAD